MTPIDKFTFQAKMENRLRALAEKQQTAQPAATVTPSVEQPMENMAEDLNALRTAAATTGRFLPAQLLSHTGMQAKIKLLNHFARECNILTGDQVEWILKSEVRAPLIASLTNQGILYDHLSRRLPPRDEFGALLFEVLFDKTEFDLESMSRKTLLELSNVLQSVGNLNSPWIQRVSTALQNASFLDSYYHIPENFMGREVELAALGRFVNAFQRSSAWSGYLMQGQGGSGKSTLLAKFCKDTMAAENTLLCILDFDRPGINAEDDHWLNDELASQLSVQSPALTENIRQFKAEVRKETLLGHLRGLLIGQGYTKPLIIILDTMEQVILHQTWGLLSKWLDRLCDIFSPIPIKVILSGRTYQQITSQNIETTVNLADFTRRTAIEFLVREGIRRVDILRLFKFDLIPFRPLELRLISRILKQGNIDLDELVSDIAKGKNNGIAEEYFMGSVYRRILDRIDNPSVRKIAYPGLILRYINPEIILSVLQPVLKLSKLDDQDAARITKDLERYAWLAQRDRTGNVWHRRDLRQVMLRQMLANEPDQVLAIQQNAITYFENLSTPESQAEVLYHRMMIHREDYFFVPEPAELVAAVGHLSRDLSDLPETYNGMIRYAQTGEIDSSQTANLPLSYFLAAYDRTGKTLIARGLIQEAFELYLEGLKREIRPGRLGERELYEWEAEALFQTANFNLLSQPFQHPLPSPVLDENPGRHIISLLAFFINDRQEYFYGELEQWFQLPRLQQTDWYRLFSTEHAKQYIERLTFALTLWNYNRRFSTLQCSAAAYIARMVTQSTYAGDLQESLLILDLLAGKSLPEQYPYSINSINIDQQWLEGLNHKQAPKPETIQHIIDTITEASEMKIPARQLISNIDTLAEFENSGPIYMLNVSEIQSSERINYLCGPQNVLRTSCKWAIYKAIEEGMSPSVIRNAAGEFNSALVGELDRKVFRKRSRDSHDWLDALIELIDRQWKLPAFIDRISTEWPHTGQLADVNELLKKWIRAKNSLFIDLE
ncbi:hypothetical protein [Pedobacter rhizosphaerae]|uniref:AAA ATPase domain-containing protein n=1 Tax=Pedobacter rhizosphaerae TaxID=390241 RepID=A0A1H9T0C4_9SPHI|nr:hypothetical protein [Pedobacter rhizosphaerae]SER90685.1 hypothetical protein SAMN04488023_12033 [Pedobacter rhizosphaerae]